MTVIALFARKEQTADPVPMAHGLSRRLDTVLYRDPQCRQVVARWPWYLSNCPRRGQKQVTLNCYRWSLT